MNDLTLTRNRIADAAAHLTNAHDAFMESDADAVALRNVDTALATLAAATGAEIHEDDEINVIFDVTNAWHIFVDYVIRRTRQDGKDALAEWNALRPLADGNYVAGILSDTAAAKAIGGTQDKPVLTTV